MEKKRQRFDSTRDAITTNITTKIVFMIVLVVVDASLFFFIFIFILIDDYLSIMFFLENVVNLS